MRYMIMTMIIVGFFAANISVPESWAHCDTLAGPVVSDARKALYDQDVTPLLKWVREDQEPLVKEAFQKTLKGRVGNFTMKERTDMDFFSTVVKLHQEAEGKVFSGIKPVELNIDPVVKKAEAALGSGSLKSLEKLLIEEITTQLRDKFKQANDKKKTADESVAAGREFVDVYTQYMHFVEDIHSDAIDKPLHHDEVDERMMH